MSVAVSTAFDLRSLIREVLATSAATDPRDLAREVAARVPVEHLRGALELALVEAVRVVSNRERHANREASVDPVRPSKKWSDASDLYLKVLRQREYISTDGEWKFLGDCTKDDLTAAAQLRFEQASRNVAVAKKYEKLASAMSDGQTVADLPQTLVLEALR